MIRQKLHRYNYHNNVNNTNSHYGKCEVRQAIELSSRKPYTDPTYHPGHILLTKYPDRP